MGQIIKIVVLIFIFGFLCCTSIETGSPKRPSGVPKNAYWYGGIDGGVWLQIQLIDTNSIDCSIYRDYTGELEYSGVFKLSVECKVIISSLDSIHNYINGYDGEKILISNGIKYCSLTAVTKQ